MNPVIPDSVQEGLRCVECNELLSCGPVFLVHETSDAICGRCSLKLPEEGANVLSTSTSEIQNRSRNVQYEALAKLHSFPCRYANFGCPELMHFSEEKPNLHESDCEFRSFVCPVAAKGSCDWINSHHKLLEHCRDEHPGHLFENPCVLPRPDITKSHLKNFLISAYNFLFLLNIKVCISSGKFYHSVRMFGDLQSLNKFSYLLEIEGNNRKLIEYGSVLEAGIMMLQESSAVSILINNLSGFLDGKYYESKFIITIQTSLSSDNLKCQSGFKTSISKVQLPVFRICVNCSKNIINVSEPKFCEKCLKKLVKCKFGGKCCLFVDLNKHKRRKHEEYFCEYQIKCYYCKVNFVDGSFIEHLVSSNSCRKTIKSNINSIVRVIPNTNFYYYFILFSSNNIGTIICRYNLSDSIVNLNLYTCLSSYELKNYKCSIEFTDPQTKYSKIFTPQIDYSNWIDWYINEKIDNFPSWKNIGIDMKINIYEF